jgi:threonine synthase
MNAQTGSYLTHLECPECGQYFDAHHTQTICRACNSPLLPRYDLAAARQHLDREELERRRGSMWRWRELLPVIEVEHIVTLGEGSTPVLALPRLGADLGLTQLFIKDEAGNPTGSFKARGMSAAVSRAHELGVHDVVVPTAGNAGGALAAYAARAGMKAHVFMPKDAPPINILECRMVGAELELVEGLISDAGRLAAKYASSRGWFDMSTLKEPYRVEGKKTMGLELAQDFEWRLPDVVVYPTGGGTGLIGMWKAFAELEALGWIGPERPRMVVVQANGCAPVVRAFQQGAERCEVWQEAHTLASGLRVPGAYADRLILRALRESQGTAVAVSDAEIVAAQREAAAREGLFICPEGAAALAGLRLLLANDWLHADERVLVYNTGAGVKYAHLLT